jgi:hypothetical protein
LSNTKLQYTNNTLTLPTQVIKQLNPTGTTTEKNTFEHPAEFMKPVAFHHDVYMADGRDIYLSTTDSNIVTADGTIITQDKLKNSVSTVVATKTYVSNGRTYTINTANEGATPDYTVGYTVLNQNIGISNFIGPVQISDTLMCGNHVPNFMSDWIYVALAVPAPRSTNEIITFQHNLNVSLPLRYALYFCKNPPIPDVITQNAFSYYNGTSFEAIPGLNNTRTLRLPQNGDNIVVDNLISDITCSGSKPINNAGGYLLQIIDTNKLRIQFTGLTICDTIKGLGLSTTAHSSGYVMMCIWK